jgi:DNA-binding transcriptional LysR family regulator
VGRLVRQATRCATEQFPVRFDQAQMSLDAAPRAWAWRWKARPSPRHIEEKKLKPIFGLERRRQGQGAAVYPAHHARPPAVAAFLEWLREQAGQP